MGSSSIATSVAAPLLALGRVPLVVSAGDFLRPAGERFEHGREDPQDFRERWLDEGSLRREVLGGATWLPALRDRTTDRSVRVDRQQVPERAVLLVSGLFLLGRGLPHELSVHVALSPAALQRRGVELWQLPALAAYDEEVGPSTVCDVLVRAEDPLRPALLEH